MESRRSDSWVGRSGRPAGFEPQEFDARLLGLGEDAAHQVGLGQERRGLRPLIVSQAVV